VARELRLDRGGEVADAGVALAGERRVYERAVGSPDGGDRLVARGLVRVAVGVEVDVDERGEIGHCVSSFGLGRIDAAECAARRVADLRRRR
jgi:hypothetical protein